jgi:hypothetical protein
MIYTSCWRANTATSTFVIHSRMCEYDSVSEMTELGQTVRNGRCVQLHARDYEGVDMTNVEQGSTAHAPPALGRQ